MGAASLARYMARVDGRMGAGQYEDEATWCRVDLVIGRRDGAVAAPITALLASPQRNTIATLVRTPVGDVVRPATVLTTHLPVDNHIMHHYVMGPAQLGAAEAVDGATSNRRCFPLSRLNDLVMLAVLHLPPELANEPPSWPSEQRVRHATRNAVSEAIQAALEGINTAGVVSGFQPSLFAKDDVAR